MAGSSTIIQPDVQFTVTPAQTSASNNAQKVLLVAQKTSAGSAVSGALNQSVSTANNAIDALFGARSFAAAATRVFRKINKVTQLDVIALSDATATPATGVIAFSGTATASGTIDVVIASNDNHKFSIAITSGDSATTVGATAVTAFTADARVPITSGNVTGTVTLTAANQGTEGNDISIKYSGLVAGITVTLTAFASGATNPSLTSVFDVVGDTRYQTIIWPESYGSTILKAFLDPRFNAGNLIQDGLGVTTKTDTYANLVTYGNLENSQSLFVNGFAKITDATHKGSSMLEHSLSVSAADAAIRSLRLTQDANISQFVIARGRDVFGGPHIASLPYSNTPYSYLPLIPIGKGFSAVEIEGLVSAGVSTLGNNTAGNTVISGEKVTTYKTDSAGNIDVSFKYLNYVDTSSNVREFFQNNAKKRFAQSRLTTGDLIEGHSMANEGIIRAYLNGLYSTLSGVGYVLTQSGAVAQKYFDDNLSIVIDTSLGKATITMKTPIITQLRTMIATIEISFSTEG